MEVYFRISLTASPFTFYEKLVGHLKRRGGVCDALYICCLTIPSDSVSLSNDGHDQTIIIDIHSSGLRKVSRIICGLL